MRGKSLCVVLFPWLWLMVVLLVSCGPSESPTPTVTPTHTPMPFGKIVADSVPARSGPGSEYDVVGTVDQGDVVKILGIEGEWYKAQSEQFSSDVWVYVKFVQEVATPPPMPTYAPTLMPTLPPPPTLTDTPTPVMSVTPD